MHSNVYFPRCFRHIAQDAAQEEMQEQRITVRAGACSILLVTGRRSTRGSELSWGASGRVQRQPHPGAASPLLFTGGPHHPRHGYLRDVRLHQTIATFTDLHLLKQLLLRQVCRHGLKGLELVGEPHRPSSLSSAFLVHHPLQCDCPGKQCRLPLSHGLPGLHAMERAKSAA
jgi:hypothetical protein